MRNDNEARLQKQLGLALEALEVLADGDGEPTDIARQTLDDITRVGMEAVALQEMDVNARSRPDTSAGVEEGSPVAWRWRYRGEGDHPWILGSNDPGYPTDSWEIEPLFAAHSPTAEQRADTAALAGDAITDICNGAVMLANESDTGDRVWQAAYHAVMATKVALRASPDGQMVALLREVGAVYDENCGCCRANKAKIDAALSTGAEQ